jgi:hypothetical protein
MCPGLWSPSREVSSCVFELMHGAAVSGIKRLCSLLIEGFVCANCGSLAQVTRGSGH